MRSRSPPGRGRPRIPTHNGPTAAATRPVDGGGWRPRALYTPGMTGVLSGAALVGVIGAGTGACASLAGKLYRAGSPGRPPQPGDPQRTDRDRLSTSVGGLTL